jgi:hypothetical protein
VVSWIPGAALARWLLHRSTSGPLERTALSVAAGLAWTSLLTWLATMLGLSFDEYVAAIQWSLAALFVVGVLRHRQRLTTDGVVGGQAAASTGVATLSGTRQRVLMVVAVILAVVSAVNPPRIEFSGDALDHIGYLRCIQTDNSLSPNGALAPRVSSAGIHEPVKSDPRKGTIHPIVSLVARIAEVDPIFAWRSLPAILFPLALLAFVWYCAAFVPRQTLVFVCALLFLLFQGGVGILYGGEVANGQNLALLYYWLIVPLVLRYAAAGSLALLVAIGLVFAGGALMHLGVVTHVAILLATLLAFHRWLSFSARNVVTLCIGGAVVAVVVLVWKFIHSLGGGNPIHVHPQGVMYVSERFFVASPFEILRQHGLVFLGGLVLIPFMLLGARRWSYARLHLAFAVIPYLVCFFPLLTPLFYERFTYMSFRSVLNVPVYAAIVAAIYGLVVWARKRGWSLKLATAVVLLIWSKLFFAPSLDAIARSASAQRSEPVRPSLFEQYDDVLQFLSSRPRGSVVLSDPMTSYLISAATDQRVVAVMGQHGNPNDPNAFDRLKAVRDVLSPYQLLSQGAAACDRYGADFVVVNGRLDKTKIDYLVDWTPELFQPVLSKLAAADMSFRQLFRSEDIVVYLYYPGTIPQDQWVPYSPPMQFGLRELHQCRVSAPNDAFRISGAEIEPRTVLPGETVAITLSYEKEDVSEYDLPVVVYIRFDHQSIAEAQGEYPGEKQVRRWRERNDGRLFRFRVNHKPFNGLIAPDRWPIALTFYETIPVKLPSNLELGTYQIEFKIARDPLLPNFTIRDMFYNRDQYSGMGCLLLDVTRQVVR